MKTCPQCQIRYPDALETCPRDGAALPAPSGAPPRTQAMYDALLGTTVDGRYLIEARLGEGGMGMVYAARHVLIDKRVAMKVLKAEAQEDPTAGQRFIQEAKSASKIRHPNIVDITDFGMLPDGSAYFVMEFLEGQTLGDVIRQGPVSPLRAIGIAAQAARGLLAAHSKGVIHRDLKPDNIFLVDRDGVPDSVKIVDFGIAKVQEGGPLGKAGMRLTQIGMVLGTPEYMSPEQATGKETDHRVDEYALGCIIYEMLTGDVPYRGETSAGTLTKHVFDPIVPPRKRRPDLEIPLALDAVVVKTMAKSPDDRYPGMKELLEALDQAVIEIESGRDQRRQELARESSRETVMSSPVSPSLAITLEQPARPRRSLPWIIGAAMAALVLVGIGAWLLRSGEPTAAPRPAAVPPTTAAVAPRRVDAAAPAQPTMVDLTFRSDPEDAEIWEGGMLIGRAPRTIGVPLSREPREYTFHKDGYVDRSERVVPDSKQLVAVTLSKQIEKPEKSGRSGKSGRSTVRLPRPRNDLRDPFKEP